MWNIELVVHRGTFGAKRMGWVKCKNAYCLCVEYHVHMYKLERGEVQYLSPEVSRF